MRECLRTKKYKRKMPQNIDRTEIQQLMPPFLVPVPAPTKACYANHALLLVVVHGMLINSTKLHPTKGKHSAGPEPTSDARCDKSYWCLTAKPNRHLVALYPDRPTC